jgi:mRNA interferase MazF
MTKGKVVLVPFPFDDLSGSKVRPAVCLTDPVGPHRHVILAFITSQVPANALDTDVILRSNDPGFAVTGLRVASAIRLHRLMTVSTLHIRRDLGHLTSDLQRAIDGRLRALFGLLCGPTG